MPTPHTARLHPTARKRVPGRRALTVGLTACTLVLALPGVAAAQGREWTDTVQLGGSGLATITTQVASLAGPSSTVILARGDLPFDALSATALLGGAELHYVESRTLSGNLQRAAADGRITRAIVVGGDAAVHPDIDAQLTSRGVQVRRVVGANRFDTAAQLARQIGPRDHAFLVSGSAVVDAVTAGGWAAATGDPVLLTEAGRLPAETRQVLAELHVGEVTVIGGDAVVGGQVLATLTDAGISVRRVAGGTRFTTALAVADARGGDVDRVVLSHGTHPMGWTDGLALASVTQHDGTVHLLTDGDTLDADTTARLLEVGGPTTLICGASTGRGCDLAAVRMGARPATTITTPSGVLNGRLTPGETFTGTLTTPSDGPTPQTAAVTGCGITSPHPVTLDGESASFVVPDGVAGDPTFNGACALAYRFTYEGGRTSAQGVLVFA